MRSNCKIEITHAFLAVAIIITATLASGQPCAMAEDEVWTPSASEEYFRILLYQAQHSEVEYYRLTAEEYPEVDRGSSLETAIEAWMIIWQCYGYTPAVAKIKELSALSPRTERHVGFSPDLTIEADATFLRITNPRFDKYSVFLFRIVNRHYEPLPVGEDAVRLLDSEGKWWTPEEIGKDHELWTAVEKAIATYKSEKKIMPDVTYSFKQVFAAPGLTTNKIRLILVRTGQGTVAIPFLENLGSSRDLAALLER